MKKDMGENINKMEVVSEELWFKYFNGEVTSMQKRAIQQWISEPKNSNAYFQALDNWERKNLQFKPNTTAAKLRFKSFVNLHPESILNVEKEAESLDNRASIFKNNWFRSLTAVVILGFVFWVTLMPGRDYDTYTTSNEEVKTIRLADKSIVVLNSNSEIRVPKDYIATDIRRIYLNGNARFSVKHTLDNKKFVVNTSHGCQIEVLGTEFDVFSSKDSSRIFLKSGSIKLYASVKQKSPAILIHPEDVVRIAKDQKVQIEPKQKYWQYKAWEDHQFVFDGSTMDEITTMLEKQFKMDIHIEDETLKSKAISGTYQWKQKEDILYILSDILNFRIEERDSIYYLKYKN